VSIDFPSTDDKPLWDLWLSTQWLPAVTAADALGVFSALATVPATDVELATRCGLNERGTRALLPMLASLGFVVRRDGRYHLTDTARTYLLPDGPFYWGGVLHAAGANLKQHEALCGALTRAKATSVFGEDERPIDAWASGQLSAARAGEIARFMHSHSAAAARGVAHNAPLPGVRRLLDVGGGSGCFAITLALTHPQLSCTVLDLPAMCDVARGYIATARAEARVDCLALDMFRDQWPSGYDAVFFSNVFHDWNLETCAGLARCAYAALPPGGSIHIHEALLDDGGAAPRTTVAFSLLMLQGTQGQQFTYAELRDLLTRAGFVAIDVVATYGYYSVVRGYKPGS
jgi:hypothetical protein